MLFSAGTSDTIEMWDIRSSKIDTEFVVSDRGNINYIGLSNRSPLMVAAHVSGVVSIWDRRKSDYPMKLMRLHEEEVRSVEFSPCETYLLTSSFDTTAKIIDWKNDKGFFSFSKNTQLIIQIHMKIGQ